MPKRDKSKGTKPTWGEPKPGVVLEDFHPTDPRSATPIGGIRLGIDFPFVPDAEMPVLEVEQVIAACENIVQGVDCYQSLLYLSRARSEDTNTLFEASRSPDIRQRWERLWVLSPFFGRLARDPDGRVILLERMREDLAAVHLLSKFAEHRNDAVKRLFKRLHDDILKILIEHLVEHRDDLRRAQLLTSIIATIETDGKVLRALVHATALGDIADDILSILYIKGRGGGSRLSAEVLRRRLQEMGDD